MIITYSNFYSARQRFKIIELEEFIERGKSVVYQPHKIDFYGLLYVEEGELNININQKELVLKAGEIFFTGPSQTQFFTKPLVAKGYVISFTEDFILANMEDNYVLERFKILLDFSEKNRLMVSDTSRKGIIHLLKALYIESREPYDLYQASILKELLLGIIFLLRRTNCDGLIKNVSNKDKYYNLAVKYKLLVTQEIKNQTELEYYLQQLNVSQSTLQLATKHIFNKTPKNILDEALIFCAKRCLTNPTARIQEISYELGFSEPTNFTKFFKKHTGYTPEYYRGNYITHLYD